MFWEFLLAHIIADFPLQTDAIVAKKKRATGLLVHTAIHCATMLVLIVGVLQRDWSACLTPILLITTFHCAIDSLKNWASRCWPQYGIIWYILDQLLHILSIIFVITWVMAEPTSKIFSTRVQWILPAVGYAFVTEVWFITERVISWKNQDYHSWVNSQMWPRMVGRAVLFSAALMGWNQWSVVMVIGGLSFHWMDLRGNYHLRALTIDVAVVCVAMFLMLF